MGTDWERMRGEGGAYLVERAAAVLKNGRLTPLALGLVEAEAQRLKFILDEEIARLEPSGDLTPAAIAALRTHYQARLDAAENVIAAARRMVETPSPTVPQRGRETEPAVVVPGPAIVATSTVARPAPAAPSRSLREFFADRSILILSYVGAFLLIVATLLFELSAFTAVDSTARFVGVLVLNLVFGVAGWLCFRLPAMRLVGRTYVAIAALMVPLTFIAAWVFLVLQQYGLSRDVAIAIAATSCALLYGALAVNLESEGYALLSLVALAVAWGAAVDLVEPGRWRGALLTPAAGVYLVIAHRSGRFARVHAVFSRLADWAIHVAALGAIAATARSAVDLPGREQWQIAAVTAALLTILYVAYGLQTKRAEGGAVAMLFLAVAWVAALNAIDLEPLTGLLLTPLVAIYILATYRSRRIPGVDVVFATWGESFIHLAALLALLWTAYSASTVFSGSPDQAWLTAAASLAVVALLYAWYATLSAQRYGGLAAMVALGLAWFCLLNGTEIWPWRGLAFTPVMAFYILVASRRPVIRELFASEPELLITGAAGVAAGWSIYATATAADPSAGSAWYPTTAGLSVIALLYGLDAHLRGDRPAPALSLGALVGAWIADLMVLQLGDWRGLALTPLAFLFALIAFRGERLGSLGAAYARVANPFVHAVALMAIAWSTYPALAEIGAAQAVSRSAFGYLAWTFGALTVAYALYCWLSKRQWMQWTVAIGVTLTTITANQAVGLDLSALAVEFLALAVGKAIVARFYRGTRMHTFLYVTAVAQAVIAAALPVEQDWLRVVILITAATMGTFMAVDSKRPEWLYLAGAFFTYGWYWLLKVVVPPPPNPGPSTLELVFSPLPVIYAAVAVLLNRFGTGLRWRLPLYGWAGAVALGVVYLGIEQEERTILGIALLAYAVGIYVATAVEDEPYGVPGASLAGALGLFSLLMAASAAWQWYPLTLTLVAWAIYAAGFAWRRSEREIWKTMHRFSGLALMALTALACFTVIDFSTTGNPAAFAALAAIWALALMFALDARMSATPAFDYAALITASLGSYWIARYLGADNVQWYVIAPGLALVAGGIMLHGDRRFTTPLPSIANAWIGVGSAGLLGTTAFQTLDPATSASLYTGLLLGESIGALLVGIATRSRALVLAGAAGAALASLRALVILIQQVPLFIVFGLVAILLLGGAAALAVLRARFADARVMMTRSWNDWS
ncbi:MAG TPA: hypothetical protein VJT14_14370 [Candidatus Dormibacteraeota bacterium]|nr:hypothetical protein [Candidatus Dormibacteraeota bacterium]